MKNVNKKIYNEKAITLVALVTTVIVLLILAGVSITTIVGDNGLFSAAENTKSKTGIATEKAGIEIAMLSAKSGSSEESQITIEKFQNALNEEFGENVATVIEKKDNIFSVIFDDVQRGYEVSTDAQIISTIEKSEDDAPGTLAGEGTESSPFMIESIEDLVAFSNSVNAGNSYNGQFVKLAISLNFKSTLSYVDHTITTFGDINGNSTQDNLMTELTTGTGFTPIGTNINSAYFKGTFDGNNKTISNLYINVIDTYKGLFGYTMGATIKNITVTGEITAKGYTGGIIGYARAGTIANCKNYANITCLNSSGVTYLGGIVGVCYANVNNCYNYGEITHTGETSSQTGGIAGVLWNGGTIDRCYNYTDISGYSGLGGIVGVLGHGSNGIVTNCYNEGNVSGKIGLGGIVRLHVNCK